MAEEQKKTQQINFTLDANKTPVLYADGYLIGSNQHVVTLNFAQAMPKPNEQNIITRIALSKSQAKEFINDLKDHIEKFEV